MDERDYPNPTEFIPERFMNGDKLNPDVLEPKSFAFGYGRRLVLLRPLFRENMTHV